MFTFLVTLLQQLLGLPTKSISFDGSSDHLTMAHADFPAYDHNHFGYELEINPDTTITTTRILCKRDSSIGSAEFWLELTNTQIKARGVQTDGTRFNRVFTSTMGTGAYKKIRVEHDLDNATSSQRVRCWVDDVEITSYSDSTAPTQNPIQSTSQTVSIGAQGNGNNPFDGLIYAPKILSGTSYEPISLLDVAGDAVNSDAYNATNWTIVGSPSASSTIPS